MLGQRPILIRGRLGIIEKRRKKYKKRLGLTLRKQEE
jgi:hypothetical protein